MHIKSHQYINSDGVTVLWQPDLCIHSGVCVRGLSAVFNPAITPWIDMSKAESESVIEQVKKCPSGALSILKKD
jgi:uncharacterized Fe-S cluster protein YjdI